MTIHMMFRRWKSRPIAIVEAETASAALEQAAHKGLMLMYADLNGIDAPCCFLPGVDLRGADLDRAKMPGAYLRKADLRTATLVGSNLAGAVFRGADLRRADLRKADLRGADLRQARFSGADMRGVRLTGARLDGALIDWRWSAFAVELLRRDAGCRGAAVSVVVELAFEKDDRPFAWLRDLLRKTDSVDWAVSVLGRAILPGDNAPELLKGLAADVVNDERSNEHEHEGASVSSLYWTRRTQARRRDHLPSSN